jgi:hypothetical protein
MSARSNGIEKEKDSLRLIAKENAEEEEENKNR